MAALPLSPDLSPLQNPSFIAFSTHDSFSLNSQPVLGFYPNAANLAITTSVKSSSFSSPTTSVGFAVGQDNGLGAADGPPSAKRARHMSHSPSDHELSTDVNPPRKDSENTVGTPTEARPNPKKRPSLSGDTIDYPRRRATIACEICRSRKSRCDGARPKCRLCSELNAECVYREPGIKLDAGDKLILERLGHIEWLLQSNIFPQSNGLGVTTPSPAASTCTIHDDNLARSVPAPPTPGGMPSGGIRPWAVASTMPKNHTTPALNLLQWPKIRDLVSQRWDPQVLVQLEMHRDPLPLSSPRPPLDLTNPTPYVQAFFERVNVWYACVSPYNWVGIYGRALALNFREGPESCLVLLVIALGHASTGGSISNYPVNADPPGFAYFAAAWALLPTIMLRNDISSAQCQILASAYLFYIVRPLEAWNLLAGTSMKLQLLISGAPMQPNIKQLAERVYWNTLLFESDLLAELDLPHSNIENLEDLVQLPGAFEDEGIEEPVGRDDLWYFSAQIGLRKLLNRVSNLIYTKSSPITSTAALDPVVAELDLALTEWYNRLPEPVKFDHGRSPATAVQTVLRLRYFACRTIIFRPYVLAVLIKESAFMDPNVQENCRKCLEACIRQLEHMTAHHAGHLPYLWQGALSLVSQTLLVMGATLTPSLSALLPPPHQMTAIIDDVVREVQHYAHLAPSLRLSADIIREAEERRRIMLRSPSMSCVKLQ